MIGPFYEIKRAVFIDVAHLMSLLLLSVFESIITVRGDLNVKK